MLLESVRVLDLADGDGDAVTRLLADLGADVLKVESPGGNPACTDPPLLEPAITSTSPDSTRWSWRSTRPRQ